MRLVQLSIQRYRSIIETERLRLHDLTVLVGPNNEGKSNILQALVTSMRALSQSEALPPRVRRRRGIERSSGGYSWARDFPRALQDAKPEGRTIFNLDFELTPDEIEEFERKVGSRLNGILPIGLSFGPTNRSSFSVRKQRHSAILTAKQTEIEEFIAQHVHLQYIPASRTSEAALEVVENMISSEFTTIEATLEYEQAVETIRGLQQPILDKLELAICGSLQQVLPDVRRVALRVNEDRLRSLVKAEVSIDDGTETDLAFKGDGVQSLAALSLIRHYSEESARGRELILAVEEPEAHLHPRAIHEVGEALRKTAQSQQVVISTHSPVLVNRFTVESNIIVEKHRARAAATTAELREALGVRTSDNLEHADVILVVEGPEDERALRPILATRSDALTRALRDGTLAIQPLFGGAKLTYVLSLLQQSMCRVHAFLDDDTEGHRAADAARKENLLATADETFARFPGAQSSEIEDLFVLEAYSEHVEQKFSVSLAQFAAFPRTKGKWSDRMRLLFKHQGKRWDGDVERKVKEVIATSIATQPEGAIAAQCDAVIDNLARSLEEKLYAMA